MIKLVRIFRFTLLKVFIDDFFAPIFEKVTRLKLNLSEDRGQDKEYIAGRQSWHFAYSQFGNNFSP